MQVPSLALFEISLLFLPLLESSHFTEHSQIYQLAKKKENPTFKIKARSSKVGAGGDLSILRFAKHPKYVYSYLD